ncbi:MAG: DNA alkylation repair protein [Clostridiales bacterium]|nr:DNA alkylation repair protein [Clostridiales bacterium]
MDNKDIIDEIRCFLFDNRDENYGDFQSSLTPSVGKDGFIGVRTPILRKYAGELKKRSDVDIFLSSLPHKYFEENQLHAFILAGIRDPYECLAKVSEFLPYVDNWATCDQMNPKCLGKDKEALLKKIYVWIGSDRTYEVRFGVKMLMDHFLGDSFEKRYAEAVVNISSEEYYINMMRAWYLATALAKNYDEILPFIENTRLDTWTHNKAIQKACESFRVSDEHKAYLKTLKV